MLHPEFPVVEGKYQMTKDWSITLPGQFNRRIEDGSLVIWRPGHTIWIAVWNNNKNQTKEERLAWLRDDISPEAFDVQEENDGTLLRLRYRLGEEADDERVPAFYGFVVGEDGHVQIAIYFNEEADCQLAKGIWRSLEERLVGEI